MSPTKVDDDDGRYNDRDEGTVIDRRNDKRWP